MIASNTPNRWHILLLISAFIVFCWSAIAPFDRFTWVLEVFPGIIGIVLLIVTHSRFRFTTLVYTLVALHVMILFVGGHYTYARVPPFNWLRDTFHLTRNHYDRLGHFAQGFVPAMIAREVLLRRSPLKRGKWLNWTILSFCLAISASYELFEWAVAEFTGSNADAFLATQGDVWDTQKDMFFALIGATVALLLMTRWHDKQLKKLS